MTQSDQKMIVSRQELSEYKLADPPLLFISTEQRDEHFKENPNELDAYERDDKLCINIRWDLAVEPKSILQCRKDGEWVTIWENGNAKKGHKYSGERSLLNVHTA